MSDSIKVAIKLRPLIKRERDDNLPVQWDVRDQTIFSIDPETKRRGEHSHIFDHIFGMDANNAHVFDVAVKPIVDATVKGFNGTIFAYGQTSSGKTYTMTGTREEPGIIPLAVENIFDAIANTSTREFLLRVSYLEIYNEKVNDLLHKDGTDLKIHEDSNGQVIVKCKEEVTNCPEHVLSIMKKGEKNRRFGETNMNDRSSRSHTIFRITIESRDTASSSDGAIQVSQLNLVDLAGSERVRQTGATGDRFKEGRHINLSLSSLSLVIKQLSESKEYVNFRDSKLTRILQASLGGNAMTTIICAATPAALEETQCTLSFAARAKCIKNKPKLNEVVSDAALLKRFAKLIEKLSSELAQERQANRCGEVKEMESKLQEKDQYIQLIEDRMQLLKTNIVSSANSVENLDFKTKSRRRRTWCGPSNPSFLNHSMMLPTIQELPTIENTMSDWKAAQFTKKRSITQAPLNNINEIEFQTEMEDFELELIESERNWEMGRFSSDSEDLEDNYCITRRKRGRSHVKFLDDVSVYPLVDYESVTGSPEKPELSTPPRRQEEEEDPGTPKEVLRDTITNLANEYKTLQEFTTLEKQIYTTDTVETIDPVQYEIKYLELESKYNAAIQENEEIKKRFESLCSKEENHKSIESEKNQFKMDMEEKLVRLKKLEEERTDYECQIELLKSKHKMREKELETSLQIAWMDCANVADNQKSSTCHLQSLVDNLMKEVKALKEKLETAEISSAPQVLSTENEHMRKRIQEYDILIETERREKRKLIEELKELKKSLDSQSLIEHNILLTRNDKSLDPCEKPSSINDNDFNMSESFEKVICENLCDSVRMDAVQLNLSGTENEKIFAEIAPLELRRESQSVNGILDDVQSKTENNFVVETDLLHEIQNEKAYDEKLSPKNLCIKSTQNTPSRVIDNEFSNSEFSAVSKEPSDYTKDLFNLSPQTVEVQSDLIIDTDKLDIDLLKLEMEKLLAEKENFIKENDMLKLKTETLTGEVKKLKLTNKQIEKNCEDLENTKIVHKTELIERDSKLHKLQNKIHKLEDEINSVQSERILYEGQKCEMEKIINQNMAKIRDFELTSAEFERMNLELRKNLNAKCLELESIEMHKYENEIQNLKSYIENLEHFIKNIQTENEDLKNQLHNQSQNLKDDLDDMTKKLIQQEKVTDTLEKDTKTLTEHIGQLSEVKSASIVTTKLDSADKSKSSSEKLFEDTKDCSSIFTNASYFDEMDVSLIQDSLLLNEITGNESYVEDDKTSCNATMLENRILELEDSNKDLEVIKTDLSSTLTAGEENLSNNDIINKLCEITNAKMLLEDKNAKLAMELQLKIQESDEIKNDVQGLRLGIERLEETIHLLTTENMDMSSKLTIEKDRAKEIEAQYQEQIEDLHRRISKIDEVKMNLQNQLRISQENLINLQDTSLPNIEGEAREKIIMYQEKIDLLTMENIELSTNLMDRIDELDKLKEDQSLLHNDKCSDIDTVQELRVQLENLTQENTELSKNLMEKIEESDSLKHAYELLEKNLATPVKDLFPELKNENDICLTSTEAESHAWPATSLQKNEQFEAASQTEHCEESQSNIEDLKFSLAKLREENISLLNKVEALQQESIALKSELLTNGNGLKEELKIAKQCITKEIGFLKPELKISTLLTKTVGELLGDFIKIIMTKEQEIITKVKEDFEQEKQNLEDQKSQSADAVRRTTVWANELEADIEKLQTEISQQEKVNVTLKCEIDRLENDLKESNHEKQLLKEKIGVLENDFMSLQTELSKQSNSNNKQDEEVNAIQERERIALAAAKNREIELQNSMKSVKDQLNQKIVELTYALEQQKTKNLDLKSTLEGLQATESQLKSIIDLKSTELMKLQQCVATLEMENAQMIVEHNQLNEENENKTKHIEEITSILKIKCDEMSEYKTKLESIVPEYEIYKEQIKERKQYAEKCKHEYELFKEKVEEELNLLNDKLCDEKSKNGSLLNQLSDLNDKNKLLASEIEEQKERCEELENTNEKLNKKVRNSTSNLKVEAQIEDLKDQNEMLRNNAEGASNRITELLEVKNSITKDFAALQEKYKILLEEKKELEQVVASSNTKLASSDLQLSEICNQLESQICEKNKISLELEATKVIISQKDEDLTIAQQEIERLNLANNELDQEAEELAQEIQERLAEAEKLRNELFESQNNLKSISNNVTDKMKLKVEGRDRKSFQDMAEVEVLIQQNKELCKELETLSVTNDFLRKENVELKARVAELKSQSCNNSRSGLLEVANSSFNALPISQLPSLSKKVRELELEIVSKNGKIATLELQIQSENFPYQKKCRDLEENLSAFKHKNAILKEEVKNLQKTMRSVSAIECEACRKRQSNRRDQFTQCLPEHKTYLSGTSSGFVDEYAKVVKLEKENKLMRDLCRSRTREIKRLEKEISQQELIISEKSIVQVSLQKKLSEYEMILPEKFRVQTTSPIEEIKNNSSDKNIRSLTNRNKSPLEENVKRALKENLSSNILDDASAVKSNHISSIWTHYP